jgi:competence protein ComEC
LKKLKAIVSLVLVFLLLGITPILASPTVFMNEKQLSFEVPPVIENNRTLVPLRAIFEVLGAQVSWNGDTNTITAVKGDTTITLQIGNTIAYKNGQPLVLEVPPKTINNRTLVPLRFVSEALGAQVTWEEASQSIHISGPGQLIKVYFIDVGQGDSIYIQLPNGNDILIDGGNEADGSKVVNFLKAHGMDNDIELLVATLPQEDHIGGLPAILAAFKVDEIIDSGQKAATNAYNQYARAAKAAGCIWVEDNHQTITWGNVALQILTGSETWQDINDYSVVSRLDCGNIAFLFDGEAGGPAEASLQGDISAEILKVGQHGSRSSTSPYFLSRVAPSVAVISVGAGKTFDLPDLKTLEKFQIIDASIYRTDLSGNIVVTTDGYSYSVATD